MNSGKTTGDLNDMGRRVDVLCNWRQRGWIRATPHSHVQFRTQKTLGQGGDADEMLQN